jgi:hypothetical protein
MPTFSHRGSLSDQDLTGTEDTFGATDPVRQAEKDAVDFVLWLNGALDVLSDTPPTQEQWDKLRDKTLEQVGGIVRARIQKAAQHRYEDVTAKTATTTVGTMASPTVAWSKAMYDAAKHKSQVEIFKQQLELKQEVLKAAKK